MSAVIDLPFALPTIVAGLTLLALYGPDSPFHVNLAGTRLGIACRAGLRDAALLRPQRPTGAGRARCGDRGGRRLPRRQPRQVLRRVILPSVLPSVLAGAGLAFARAVGEFGSVVLISGNLPFKTEVASSWIYSLSQSDDLAGGQRGVGRARRHLAARAARHRLGPPPLRSPGARYEALALAPAPALRRAGLPGPARRPARVDGVLPRLSARTRRGVGCHHRAGRPARAVAHAARGRHRRAAQHDLRRGRLAHPGPPPLPGRLAARCAGRHPARHLPRRHRAGADPRLRPDRLVRQLAGRPTASR